MYILLGALGLLCMVQGAVQLLGRLGAALLAPRNAACCTLLPLTGSDPQIELRLRWAGVCVGWGWLRGPLILLDLGAGEETLAICRTWCREREWAVLCTPQELAEDPALTGVYKTFWGVLY